MALLSAMLFSSSAFISVLFELNAGKREALLKANETHRGSSSLAILSSDEHPQVEAFRQTP
jgi:hypothetical protein